MKIYWWVIMMFFVTTLSFSFYGAEGGEKKESSSVVGNYYLKFSSGYAVTSWENSPITVDQKYLAPPIFRLDLGGVAEIYEFRYSAGYVRGMGAIISSDQMLHMNLKIVTLAAGGEIVWPTASDESKLKDTQYYRGSLGFVGRVTVDLLLADIYAEYRQRTLSDTPLIKIEGIETSIGHEYDRFTKLGATFSLLGLKALGEVTWIKLGNTAILSKEFSTTLPEDDIFRITLGGGLSIGRIELLIKYQRLLDIEDEVAYLYQSTHLSPDYLMSKNTIFVEAVWKF